MWMTELAMNTTTAETRIGSHNEARLAIAVPRSTRALIDRRPCPRDPSPELPPDRGLHPRRAALAPSIGRTALRTGAGSGRCWPFLAGCIAPAPLPSL